MMKSLSRSKAAVAANKKSIAAAPLARELDAKHSSSNKIIFDECTSMLIILALLSSVPILLFTNK